MKGCCLMVAAASTKEGRNEERKKNFTDIIVNRTSDLTACSAVPQPVAPPPKNLKVIIPKSRKKVSFMRNVLKLPCVKLIQIKTALKN
jgi:hypothetical protein